MNRTEIERGSGGVSALAVLVAVAAVVYVVTFSAVVAGALAVRVVFGGAG